MPENQTSKDRLREITAGIEEGIKELFQSERYTRYLQTMSRFHRYSVNNVMLIHSQKPNATHVAGFNKWRDQFGRHVKRGEKGIQIIAPVPFKKKIEEIKRDPDTNAPLLDKDGKVITEETVVSIPMFKVVSVFDVSQTEGKPLPELASSLTGDVKQFDTFMEALRRSSPVPVRIETMTARMDGYFNSEQQDIAIRKGMSEVQTVSALIHEIAHAKLHNYAKAQAEAAAGDETAEPPVKKDRHTEEVEAESISYAVCQYYGIQTAENSFGYIASWSEGKELKELRSSLETINKTSAELIDSIDRNFREICKERGIDMSAEKEADAPAEDHQEATVDEKPSETVSQTEGQPTENAATDTELPVEEAETLPTVPEKSVTVPMPDPMLTVEDMERYGYTDADMLPLSKDRAIELAGRDITVYLLYRDNTEAMALESDEILCHQGLCGVTREDWEAVEGDIPQRDVERRFTDSEKDAFAIFQLKDDAPRELRFANMSELNAEPAKDNYKAVYVGELSQFGSTDSILESIYVAFNVQRPEDFTGHSLSVSDVIALKQDGQISYHYCNSCGYQQLSDFQKPENYLKNAEMSMEDDYGMIDGIINNGEKLPTVAELEQQASSGKPISLMDLAAAVRREQRKEKQSILERLKNKPPQKEKKDAPVRSAERDL